MGWFRLRRFGLEDRLEAMLEGRLESALDRVKLSDWLEFSDLVGRVVSLEGVTEYLEVDVLEDQRQALEVRLEVCETEGAVDRESIGDLERRANAAAVLVANLREDRDRLERECESARLLLIDLVGRVDRLSTLVEGLLERERLDGADLRGVLARVEGLEGLERLERRRQYSETGRWVICEDVSGLYWSNSDGWTVLESADRYSASERASAALPVGGFWVRVVEGQS